MGTCEAWGKRGVGREVQQREPWRTGGIAIGYRRLERAIRAWGGFMVYGYNNEETEGTAGTHVCMRDRLSWSKILVRRDAARRQESGAAAVHRLVLLHVRDTIVHRGLCPRVLVLVFCEKTTVFIVRYFIPGQMKCI